LATEGSHVPTSWRMPARRGLRAGEDLDVFRFEIAAFRTDEGGIDGLRIALRKMELQLGGQLGIRGNSHDHGIALRRRVRGRLGRLDFFELEIALLVAGGRRLGGGEPRQDAKRRRESWEDAWAITGVRVEIRR
jgi:hypothetical protein